jgi:hypothetical protein
MLYWSKFWLLNAFTQFIIKNQFAVNFCIKNNLSVAYQWSAHSTYERITSKAGFRESFTLLFGWVSYAIIAYYNKQEKCKVDLFQI